MSEPSRIQGVRAKYGTAAVAVATAEPEPAAAAAAAATHVSPKPLAKAKGTAAAAAAAAVATSSGIKPVAKANLPAIGEGATGRRCDRSADSTKALRASASVQRGGKGAFTKVWMESDRSEARLEQNPCPAL